MNALIARWQHLTINNITELINIGLQPGGFVVETPYLTAHHTGHGVKKGEFFANALFQLC